MGKPCPPSNRHTVIPQVTKSGLRFSRGQNSLLKELARKSRTLSMAPCFRNQSEISHGILALFTGSRGTGKTLGAEIVARGLGRSVYRVNLNQVVSGQTEKNLSRVLMTAEQKKTVLLFDKADAFGETE